MRCIVKRQHVNTSTRQLHVRRGFNLVELLLALAITSALLTATMVALNASFMAYQVTTEVASTHTIGRLTMHRMLALIRTGKEFGPFPTTPLETTVMSDDMEFVAPNGQIMTLHWVEDENALYVAITDPATMTQLSDNKLLEGVVPQYDPNTGDRIKPFTLEYYKGRKLYRATIDMTIVPDDNMSVELDGDNQETIRLVASAMPRMAAY